MTKSTSDKSGNAASTSAGAPTSNAVLRPPYLNQQLPDHISSTIRELILSYLVFNCYEDTAKSFAKAILHGKSSGAGSVGQGESAKSPSLLAKLGNSWDSILPALEQEHSKVASAVVSSGSGGANANSAAPNSKMLSKVGSRKRSLMSRISIDVVPMELDGGDAGDMLMSPAVPEEPAETATTAGSGGMLSPLSAVAQHSEMTNSNLSSIIGSLNDRRDICRNIVEGKIGLALELCAKAFPSVLVDYTAVDFVSKNKSSKSTSTSAIAGKSVALGHDVSPVAASFLLHTQHFIELIRAGSQAEALFYGQNVLRRFGEVNGSLLETLRDVGALLAYENPHECPLSHLLSQDRRDHVAGVINSAIMVSLREMARPSLETIVKQSTVAMNMLASETSSTKNKKSSSSTSLLVRSFSNWKLHDLLNTQA